MAATSMNVKLSVDVSDFVTALAEAGKLTRAAVDIAATTGISMEEACAAIERLRTTDLSRTDSSSPPFVSLAVQPETAPVDRHHREVDL